LIVEDNEGIAGLLTIMLGKAGLQVVWCQNGQEALEKFGRLRESVAFVLSDCRLPDGDGREICRQMREQRPDLPLLLSSGNATCLNLGPLKSGRLVGFLPKPYSPKELLEQVQRLHAEVKAMAGISSGFV
jgi:CheY-like chemotaxis protein